RVREWLLGLRCLFPCPVAGLPELRAGGHEHLWRVAPEPGTGAPAARAGPASQARVETESFRYPALPPQQQPDFFPDGIQHRPSEPPARSEYRHACRDLVGADAERPARPPEGAPRTEATRGPHAGGEHPQAPERDLEGRQPGPAARAGSVRLA